ncbi:hypothetical protein M0R04_15140 [Candidatus Dojkabacteria bacterium]|jgi:hypothetical protein|nr:hypothetical protein [Candidatus Dojkabacteria bacterium]
MKKLTEFFNTKYGKIALEAFRWGLFVGLSAIISKALELLAGIPQDNNVILFTFILRFLDAILHKSGIAEKGISRF